MERLERTMGILLLLRGGRVVSAAELAARFEVSQRTIYRDIEVLSGLGVPVSAEMGRTGGFRLGEGFFLPPVTLAPEEAISLIVGLCLMRRLRVMPFPKEAELAERKLLAALPEGTARLVSACLPTSSTPSPVIP
jgi:predicted DNA-binding transcriptional regulator YafY